LQLIYQKEFFEASSSLKIIFKLYSSFKHPNKPHMGDANTRGYSLPEVVVDDVLFAAGQRPVFFISPLGAKM
jgi:hypothetical protein